MLRDVQIHGYRRQLSALLLANLFSLHISHLSMHAAYILEQRAAHGTGGDDGDQHTSEIRGLFWRQ